MPFSYKTWVGDGATTAFAFTFDYLSAGHLEVLVDDVSTSFTLSSTYVAVISPAPAVDAVIELRRTTPSSSPLVDYTGGSVLLATDLDTANLQTLFVAQEAVDSIGTALKLDPINYDASGAKVINLGAGTDATDAVNKAQLDAVSVAAGNVVSPSDPADDNKFLMASGGAWSWAEMAVAKIADAAAFMKTFLTSADVAAARSNLGATATGDAVMVAADAAAVRTLLSLVPGTDVLAPTGDGTLLTGVSSAADLSALKGQTLTQLMYNRFLLAVLNGAAFGYSNDGMWDVFEDQSGIDVTASLNKFYNPSLDLYSPAPIMAWDEDRKNATITIDPDGLSVSGTTSYDGVHSLAGADKSAGSWYFECLITEAVVAGMYCGIAKDAQSTISANPQLDANGWMFNLSNGNKTLTSEVGFLSACSVGDIVMFGYNADSDKLWIGKNGVFDGDPVAGTGEAFSSVSGTLHPFAIVGSTGKIKLLLDANSHVYPAPEGFGAWGEAEGQDMDLISQVVVAGAAPESARLVALVEYISRVTNWFSHSEKFDNAAWTKGSLTVSANEIANPINGAVDADKLEEGTTVGGTHTCRFNQTLVSGQAYTLSVYAKADERSSLNLEIDNNFARFNLATGGSSTWYGSFDDIGTEDIGDGWWRCWVHKTAGSSGSKQVQFTMDNGTNWVYDGVAGNGVHLWGAQFEEGHLSPYIKGGVTNLFADTVDLNTWTKSNITVAAAAGTDPAGGGGASKVEEANTTTTTHTLYTSVTTETGQDYVYSVYVKADERSHARIYANGHDTLLDLSTGEVTLVTGSPDDYGAEDAGNGWWRAWIKYTEGTGGSRSHSVALHNGTTDNYAGVVGEGVLVYGFQIEEGSQLTDYVHGQSGQVGDTPVLGVQLETLATRDGGTTWSEATPIEEIGSLADGLKLISADIDLSGNPSGTDMQWMIRAREDKVFEVHAAGLIW